MNFKHLESPNFFLFYFGANSLLCYIYLFFTLAPVSCEAPFPSFQKMQRQKSILSFFQKPSQENQNSGTRRVPQFPVTQRNVSGSDQPKATDPVVEIRGTDTPPEKVPRQIFPASFVANDDSSGSSLFSSIMHKFVKADDRERASDRYYSKSSINQRLVRVLE